MQFQFAHSNTLDLNFGVISYINPSCIGTNHQNSTYASWPLVVWSMIAKSKVHKGIDSINITQLQT